MMPKIGKVDLDFLYLAVSKEGCFDERDIQNSKINKLGTGEILDRLADLRDRGLLEIVRDKFCITEAVKKLLWEKTIPLEVRILRLLNIAPFSIKEISRFLLEKDDVITKQAEILRKNGLVMMVPIKKEGQVQKTYEILPEGIERLDEVKKISSLKENTSSLRQLIGDLEEQIKELNIDGSRKDSLIKKIEDIRTLLNV